MLYITNLIQATLTIALFTLHVPVFFCLSGITLEIVRSNFAIDHNLHTANYLPNLKTLA